MGNSPFLKEKGKIRASNYHRGIPWSITGGTREESGSNYIEHGV
ncbi:MAG: hypothetical protein V3U06_10085 [Candidatus Binatia bacterium]